MDTVEELNSTYFYAGRSNLTASQLLQTSGGRSHQFVSARQYKAACNEADEFSARVICEGSRFRLLS